ncbi:hypothetical protein MEA186_10886 [Mesorhizobium amorphae CCNWGS0123]|uniref:Uncharacterized protein n=1 Tax=Mesorhizobium amorphae CCNWGS0123 TaxID=1082933 RepID=G6Y8B0_9HYPH|nr:hypothetical protein MEA186_10886 [Mesorhizobium amorphae CCNWGS0123]
MDAVMRLEALTQLFRMDAANFSPVHPSRHPIHKVLIIP